MKKLICLVLIFALMLTACSKWEIEIVDPEESSETSSEERKPLEVLNENQKKAIKILLENELKYEVWDILQQKYIFGEFRNIQFYDENCWSAVMVLDKLGKTLEIPVEGISYYSEDGYVSNIYGKIQILDDETAVFCGKEKALFFSTETLEPLDINLEIPTFEGEETWVNGAGFNKMTGKYVLFATGIKRPETEGENAVMFIYDENGKIESKTETAVHGSSYSIEEYLPYYFPETQFFEYKGETFLYTGYNAVGLESGTNVELYDATKLENGDFDLKIVGCHFSGTEYKREYMAFLSKNGGNEKVMVFDGTDFSDPMYSGNSEPPTFEVNGDILTYRHEHFAMEMTLDFAKESCRIEYKPDDSILETAEKYASSRDGKYAVYSFGLNGAGDVLNYHLSIRNSETKKHVYLGTSGGMYGGYNGVGFLKNNDVYIFNLTKLNILDPETGEIKFDLGKNFPLFYDDETEKGRYMLTFRRDPEDFSFIVIYYEFEGGRKWTEVESEEFGWHEEADCNYKIAFLDAEGNLLEGYDTGVPVWGDQFGIHRVDMRYSPEKLTVIVRNSGKGQSGFDGVFDMETKEFTVFAPKF